MSDETPETPLTPQSAEPASNGKAHSADSDPSKLLQDPHRVIADTKLIGRAARRRWPVSRRVRKVVVNELETIVKNSVFELNKIAASKTLKELDELNAKREADEANQGRRPADVNITQTYIAMQNLPDDQLRAIAALREKVPLPAPDQQQ
jgi:hypothetical protein